MTNQTAAIEVLARLLCAADVHVHGNATWQQMSTTLGRSVQDGYRDAARWLLPRMTVATAPAAVPVPLPADQTAPLAEVWVVWRDDERAHGYFATEDAAKQATIDCWEEDEPVCPDYSWRRDGPRWELVVGGEHGGVYASRHRVYGAPETAAAVAVLPEQTDRAAVLLEAADFVRGLLLTRTSITTAGLEAELRQMAAEEQPARSDVGTEFVQQKDRIDGAALAAVEEALTPRCDLCKRPGHSFEDCPDAELPAAEEQPAETQTQEPPTEADIVRAHVLAVHQIGEQLAGIETWMWEHLANVRATARPAVGEQAETQEAPRG